jgi:hypothetical protein
MENTGFAANYFKSIGLNNSESILLYECCTNPQKCYFGVPKIILQSLVKKELICKNEYKYIKGAKATNKAIEIYNKLKS